MLVRNVKFDGLICICSEATEDALMKAESMAMHQVLKKRILSCSFAALGALRGEAAVGVLVEMTQECFEDIENRATNYREKILKSI